MSPETATAAANRAGQLETTLRKVIRGKDDVIRLALVSVFAHLTLRNRRATSEEALVAFFSTTIQ